MEKVSEKVIKKGKMVESKDRSHAEEEKTVSVFSQPQLGNDLKNASEQERDALRKDWENLPKPTREKIIRQVMRGRLGEMRKKISGLTAEQRKARIDEDIEKMRERYKNLSDEEKQAARERMNSGEARVMIEKVMGFYQNELTAKERAELDPLMQEWFNQIENLSQ